MKINKTQLIFFTRLQYILNEGCRCLTTIATKPQFWTFGTSNSHSVTKTIF